MGLRLILAFAFAAAAAGSALAQTPPTAPQPRPPVAQPAPAPSVTTPVRPVARAAPAPKAAARPAVRPPPAPVTPAAMPIPCVIPASPTPPPETRPPSIGELNAFSSALSEHQRSNTRYLACLDVFLSDGRRPQSIRSRALTMYNAVAPETDRLWEAYARATDRYRADMAVKAKAASQPARPIIIPADPAAPTPR